MCFNSFLVPQKVFVCIFALMVYLHGYSRNSNRETALIWTAMGSKVSSFQGLKACKSSTWGWISYASCLERCPPIMGVLTNESYRPFCTWCIKQSLKQQGKIIFWVFRGGTLRQSLARCLFVAQATVPLALSSQIFA